MTPAETLREAARLMRERAQAATPSPWRDSAVDGNRYAALVSDTMPIGRPANGGWDSTEGYGGYLIGESIQNQDRAHIASWHPTVALAVAEVLEHEAAIEEQYGASASTLAVAVARAYLGETAPAHAVET